MQNNAGMTRKINAAFWNAPDNPAPVMKMFVTEKTGM